MHNKFLKQSLYLSNAHVTYPLPENRRRERFVYEEFKCPRSHSRHLNEGPKLITNKSS